MKNKRKLIRKLSQSQRTKIKTKLIAWLLSTHENRSITSNNYLSCCTIIGRLKFKTYQYTSLLCLMVLNLVCAKVDRIQLKRITCCLFVCLFVSGFITPNEFENMNTRGADTMMFHAGKTHPKYRPRYSYQTFVNQRYLKDPMLDRIIERQVNKPKSPWNVIFSDMIFVFLMNFLILQNCANSSGSIRMKVTRVYRSVLVLPATQ